MNILPSLGLVFNASFNNGWQEVIVSFDGYNGVDNYIVLGHELLGDRFFAMG